MSFAVPVIRYEAPPPILPASAGVVTDTVGGTFADGFVVPAAPVPNGEAEFSPVVGVPSFGFPAATLKV